MMYWLDGAARMMLVVCGPLTQY